MSFDDNNGHLSNYMLLPDYQMFLGTIGMGAVRGSKREISPNKLKLSNHLK